MIGINMYDKQIHESFVPEEQACHKHQSLETSSLEIYLIY